MSNDVQSVSAHGDTVFILNYDQHTSWGYNYSTDKGKTWHGAYTSFDSHSPNAVAYGAGYSVVTLNPNDWAEKPRLWYYPFKTNSDRLYSVTWPDKFQNDTLWDLRVIDVVFAGGKFYLGSIDGGVIRFDPMKESVRAYPVGGGKSIRPDSLVSKPDTVNRLSGLSPFTDDSGRVGILVTTRTKVRIFYPADSSWDSIGDGISGKIFDRAICDPSGKAVFAFVSVNGSDTSEFYRFNPISGEWVFVAKRAPDAFTFAGSKLIYTVRNSNAIELCAIPQDTVSADTAGPLKVLRDSSYFAQRIVSGTNSALPQRINDMLYAPSTDTTGDFWLAASNGIFLSSGEKPLAGSSSFVHMRYVEKVNKGLKSAYALPGILSFEDGVRFMYRLAKDAKVTISVYDYNMSLVKTVINGEARKASSTGSMDENRDVWNGTDRAGRTVIPGVYYFKITTDKGERGFGKIIVAKQ